MRGMRNALWALGLAGAAYAWRNRSRLQQQFGNPMQQRQPWQLPNPDRSDQRWPEERRDDRSRERDVEFGGSSV